MRFYTKDESLEWLKGLGLVIPGYPAPWSDGAGKVQMKGFLYPNRSFLAMARRIAEQIPEDPVMLLLVDDPIFSGFDNEHLYYRLRQSYGDFRFLLEAPGHVFLEHERADFVSFLQLSMLNGYGGYILSQGCDVGFYFTHNENIVVFGDTEERVNEVAELLVG